MVVSKFLYFLIYESKHGLSSLDVCSLQHRLSWRARGYKRPLRPHNSSWPPDPCRMSAIESLERKPAALCSQPKSWPDPWRQASTWQSDLQRPCQFCLSLLLCCGTSPPCPPIMHT